MLELTRKQGIEAITQAIMPMRHNSLRNYTVPGLTSHLIGGAEFGKVRLFHAERTTRDVITPHSHRFDFTCLVLSGWVRNTIYHYGAAGDEMWCLSSINQVCGVDGLRDFKHTREDQPTRMRREVTEYKPGDVYSMVYTEIHSIEFSHGTQVLFFEGPQQTERSWMIEPWCDGGVIPTFRTEYWMFLRDAPS